MRDHLPAIPVQPLRYEAPGLTPTEYESPGISLQQLLAIARAYRKKSIFIGIGCFLLIAVVGLLQPRQYDASVTVLINPEVNDPISGKEFPVQMLANYMATQLELITSTVVLRLVVEKLKLHEDERIISDLELPEDVRKAAAERDLQERLTVVQKTYGSQLVTIFLRDESPVGAADIVNAIAEVYVSRVYERNVDSDKSLAAFAEQLDELKTRADSAQEKFAGFQKRTGLVNFGDKDDQTATALSELEGDLLEAQSKRRTLEIEAGTTRASALEGGPNSEISEIRAKLGEQEALMSQYRLTDGPRNPRVIELQTTIDATRAELSRASRSISSSSNAELSAARQLEARLKAAIDDQRKRVITQGELIEEGRKLKLEVDTAQTNYRRAFEKFDEISRSSASSYNNLKIVSRATPPTRASSRRTRTTLAIALVLGGGAGVVLPLAWGLLFRRVRCRDDIERDFGTLVIVEFNAIPDAGR
jgi:succinoglycan biosynthesis transport protein ExoP